jgi:hypothetical protein
MAADSTMLRMVNLLIALSLGVHREQLEQRMGLTWPRPFLLRPLSEESVFAQPRHLITACKDVSRGGGGDSWHILGRSLLDHIGGMRD